MIKITIQTENAAFDDDQHTSRPELARILHNLANELETDYRHEAIYLRDINGNTWVNLRRLQSDTD